MLLSISLVMGLQLAVTTPARPLTEVLPVPHTQAGVYHGRSGAVDVAMPAPQKADVVIDGKLDEPVWRSTQLRLQ